MKYLMNILVACVLILANISCTQLKSVVSQGKPSPESLSESWQLVGMRGIDRSDEGLVGITLQINLTEQTVSGYNGCNRYFGSIAQLDSGVMEFAPLASTRMACPEDSLEVPFMEQMRQVRHFSFLGDTLSLDNQEGVSLLLFVKSIHANKGEPDPRLATIADEHWSATHILGKPIEGGKPELQINLADRRINGHDTCNLFTGSIESLTDKAIGIQLATTLRICPDMETANAFGAAIGRTVLYKFTDEELVFLDENSSEVLRFTKVVKIECMG